LQPHARVARINHRMGGDVRQLLQARRYREALEALLDRHEQQVFRMALAMLRDRGRAEEVTQDVFLKVWAALPAYDGRALPSTWLYSIARNTCLSALRAASYRRTIALEDVAEPAADPVADSCVRSLLARLPHDQRLAITLFYWEDRSVKEVAALMDLPEGTAKSLLHRARVALGAMMEGQ
jgi:RNA polymerase sigma-70 factor (ECF subfamily)